MSRPSIDQRVARTRARLHEAHRALILAKGYEAITIRDVCAAAKVARSTFYAHYKNMDDLRGSSFEPLRRDLVAQQARDLAAGDDASRFGFSLQLLEHARDHIQFYRAHAGSKSGAAAVLVVRKMVADLVRAELIITTTSGSISGIQREFVVEYVVGAYVSVLTWWLDRGATLAPDRVDAIFRELLTTGIGPLKSKDAPSARP